LARLALPVRAVITQLWSLAVLDQLRLVRSRRLVFAGHDGVRDVRTSSAVVRSRWVTTPQRLSRNTNSAHHERSTVPRRTGIPADPPRAGVVSAPRTYASVASSSSCPMCPVSPAGCSGVRPRCGASTSRQRPEPGPPLIMPAGCDAVDLC
jgi:hypothetical protein